MTPGRSSNTSVIVPIPMSTTTPNARTMRYKRTSDIKLDTRTGDVLMADC